MNQHSWISLDHWADALCRWSVFCDNVRYEWRQWRDRKAERERGADLMLQRIQNRWGR